jgi:diamine N-acetyltransferase
VAIALLPYCQVGITLKQTAWNHGYAQELMPAVLRHGFSELGMNKIYLQVFTTNAKARHLYQKLGFREEGVLRAHYFVNGAYHDMVSMSMLREEMVLA